MAITFMSIQIHCGGGGRGPESDGHRGRGRGGLNNIFGYVIVIITCWSSITAIPTPSQRLYSLH